MCNGNKLIHYQFIEFNVVVFPRRRHGINISISINIIQFSPILRFAIYFALRELFMPMNMCQCHVPQL